MFLFCVIIFFNRRRRGIDLIRWTEHMDREKPKLEAHPSNRWTQNQEKTNGSNTKKFTAQWTHPNSPKLQMNPESKLLLPRVTCTIKAQMILGRESQAKRIALCRIFLRLDGSEWVLGVRVNFDQFWDVFFTYLVLE